MTGLVTGLVLFLGVHSISIFAPDWRDRTVSRIGAGAWRAIYSVIALAGLILIVTAYSHLRGQTAFVYQLPRWIQGITATLMLPVFPLLIAAYLPGLIRALARHPMLVAVK